jgi:hypothetical protein
MSSLKILVTQASVRMTESFQNEDDSVRTERVTMCHKNHQGQVSAESHIYCNTTWVCTDIWMEKITRNSSMKNEWTKKPRRSEMCWSTFCWNTSSRSIYIARRGPLKMPFKAVFELRRKKMERN